MYTLYRVLITAKAGRNKRANKCVGQESKDKLCDTNCKFRSKYLQVSMTLKRLQPDVWKLQDNAVIISSCLNLQHLVRQFSLHVFFELREPKRDNDFCSFYLC